MGIPNKEYEKMTKNASPSSPIFQNCLKAFLVGGCICALGEILFFAYIKVGLEQTQAELLVPVTLILCTAILTAMGVFDKIAKFAGAGTVVPITGFANAVVSPALEFSSEGHILGTGAEMFRIAGPVLVYGSTAAVLYGLFFWIFSF